MSGEIEEKVIDATLVIRDPRGEEVGEESPPIFQDPAMDPNLGLEGRWMIEWSPESGEPPGYATLSRGAGYVCNSYPCAFQRDPDAGWKAHSNSVGQDGAASEKVEFSGVGKFLVQWGYGHLGSNGGTSEVEAVSDDFLTGKWTYRERTGSETWTRIEPVVERIDAYSKIEDSALMGERPVKVLSGFNPKSDAMRGNVPSFYLEVRGKALFGSHYYWFPPSSGLEIVGFYYMCTLPDGEKWYNRTYGRCLGSGVEVDGLQFEIKVWNAKPGTHAMLLNGVEIPIDLELIGYVDPADAKLAIESCSVISEVDPERNMPLLFTRYDPAPKPPPAE